MPPRPTGQQQLGLGDVARRERRTEDYLGVFPRGVMPTTVGALECGEHLLFIKNMRHGQTIPPAQDRLYKIMTRYGHPDAPGSVTVLVVWGGSTTPRATVRYDHLGKSEPVAYTNDEYAGVLTQWWNDHRVRR